MKTSSLFTAVQCIVYMLALVIASLLSFFDRNNESVWIFGTIFTFFLVLTLLILQLLRALVYFSNRNHPDEDKRTAMYNCSVTGTRYWYIFFILQLLKLSLILNPLSNLHSEPPRKFVIGVSILISIEGYIFLLLRFETPRHILKRLYRSIQSIAWIIFIMLMTWWVFSLGAWCMFSDVTPDQMGTAGGNPSDDPFNNILMSSITLVDMGFGDFSMVRVYERIVPGSSAFFVLYAFMSYYILANILITVFIDQYHEKLNDTEVKNAAANPVKKNQMRLHKKNQPVKSVPASSQLSIVVVA